MANNPLDIRQLAGWIGVDSGVSGGMILGERHNVAQFKTQSIALSTTALVQLSSDPIPLKPSEALLIEYMGGAVLPVDANGSLTLNSIAAFILDNTAAGCAVLQIIATVPVVLAKLAAGPAYGFFIEPPMPLRPRDLRTFQASPGLGLASVSPYTVVLNAILTNADAGSAHSVTVEMSLWYRVISGVNP